MQYQVSYDGFGILVEADSIEIAKEKAYESFSKFYPAKISYERFMTGITDVRLVTIKCSNAAER